MRIISLILILSFLAACGHKTDLRLPTEKKLLSGEVFKNPANDLPNSAY